MGNTYNIQALKDKDPDTLTRVVTNESAKVYRCISRLIRDPDEIENLTQETFLQAFTNIDSFRGEARLSTWLCAIGINLARAFLRKNKRYDSVEEQDIETLVPKFGFMGQHKTGFEPWNPEKHTENKERSALLHRALAKMPDDYRMVITLRDLEEFSSKETAEILKISEGAVRVRLHRARQVLRGLLNEYFA